MKHKQEPPEGLCISRRRALQLLILLTPMGLSASRVASASQVPVGGSQKNARYVPQALSTHQYDLVTVVSEMMIPATDTTGATAAAVNQFIDTILARWNAPDERTHFLAELCKVDATAKQAFDRPFLELQAAERAAVLTNLEAESSTDASGKLLVGRKPFFRMMKEYTLTGYYTSQIGGAGELAWIPVPGSFGGCVPYGSGSRATLPY